MEVVVILMGNFVGDIYIYVEYAEDSFYMWLAASDKVIVELIRGWGILYLKKIGIEDQLYNKKMRMSVSNDADSLCF
jgi:hypothetical protein